MKLKKLRSGILLLMLSNIGIAQQLPAFEPLAKYLTPLELAEYVSNNIIDQTEFQLQYVIQKPYPDIEVIDFAQNFDKSESGVAYALSTLISECAQTEIIEVGSSAELKIWVNGKLEFTQTKVNDFPVLFEEKTYVLPEKFSVKLKKGENRILVKSAYSGEGKWILFLQSNNMGRYAEKGKKITTSIQNYVKNIDMANWLLLGSFENEVGKGIDYPFEPEQKIEFYRLYKSGNRTFTWDIPHIHINTENLDVKNFYNWSYHVGGFMWGLQRLSQVSGNHKYADFADKWCEYTLSTIPLVEYQTKELHAVRSMNWGIAGRPMLDYTTAPSLPFMARLTNEKTFPLRQEYMVHAEKILDYVINNQFRLPSGVFARKYTIFPSVWVDDMFMGIPYLLLSAEYTDDLALRQKLYDDAANQVIQFSKLLFKKESQLFMQACYVDHPDEIIPFWSRGNGWAIWGTSEVLQRIPKDHKQYKAILNLYREHVKGIVKEQDNQGYWHNILNMPETVRESSGTAIFTYCIARGINNGWLNKKEYGSVVEKGWHALKSFIDKDGNLYGVKGGTNFSTDPEDYAKIPFVKSDTHGIFPLLFACIEMNKFLNK